ncbi:MAG: RsiV family protein, partial [Clostridia bacterium]|nr:RsiV family protein [Clostridia bacterium]
IDSEQNFYFADNGNIVIVFEKYEVAPGYMGSCEFEIPKEIYHTHMK